MDLESYDNLAFNDIEFWSNDNTLKASKPAFDEVFDIIPEYTGVDLRSEINRLKRELPKPNTLAELLTEESPTADPTDMPSLFTNDKAVKKELSNLQKVPSLNDIYKNTAMTEMLPAAAAAAAELPLFTPGTNRKMSLALKTEFGLFEYERKRLNIPKNPSAWSHFHVKQWLAWIGTEFNITNVDSSKFKKTGRELFEMGEDAFLAIAPPFTGDILWEHLNFLVRESSNVESDVLVDQAVLAQDLVDANRNIDSSPEDGQISQSYQLLNDVFFNSSQAYTPQLDPPPPYTESSYTYNAGTTTASSDHKQFRHRLSQSMSGGCVIENEMHDQTVPSVKQELSSWDALSCSWGSRASPTTESQKMDMSPTNDNAPSSGNLPDIPGYAANGPIQLWQFLLQLLMDKNCQHIICWTGDGWEFKVLDTEELAKRWGARKNKPRMTYEKLSRGIRYYYDKKLIRKTSGKRYTYLYVCDLGGMLSHTPESLFQACGVSPRYDDEVYH